MPPKQILGQGSLVTPESAPEPREFTPDERVAISGMIKWFSDSRNIDPGLVTERDVTMLTPAYIESGLYVPAELTDRDMPQARGHVIFPASEYRLLTVSPSRLAESAATGVRNRRSQVSDKAKVEVVAGRASAHALESQLSKTDQLVESLQSRQDSLKTIRGELKSARGTGFFAHYSADKVKMIVVNGETAIAEALEVCAMSKGWNAEQLERAKRTLNYKLFGDHSDRFRNWKDFSHMAHTYTRKRKLVVVAEQQRLTREFLKYKPFLDEE